MMSTGSRVSEERAEQPLSRARDAATGMLEGDKDWDGEEV